MSKIEIKGPEKLSPKSEWDQLINGSYFVFRYEDLYEPIWVLCQKLSDEEFKYAQGWSRYQNKESLGDSPVYPVDVTMIWSFA